MNKERLRVELIDLAHRHGESLSYNYISKLLSALYKFISMLDDRGQARPLISIGGSIGELSMIWRDGDNYAEFCLDSDSISGDELTVSYFMIDDGVKSGMDDISFDDAIFMIRQSFIYRMDYKIRQETGA
jgi:hypothetical protein